MLSITFDDFSIRFGKRVLFDAVRGRLVWDSPGVIGLMGPSGSGKSTLINALLTHRYRRSIPGLQVEPGEVAMVSVPQQPVIYPQLSVDANARLFERAGRFRASFDPALYEQLAETLRLRRVLKEGRTDRLSGGEAQRLMLLRSLSVGPDLLLLDEPCAGLDAGVRAGFLADLSLLIQNLGCAALYVGHHWEEIAAIAETVAYVQPQITTGSVDAIQVLARDAMIASPPTTDAFQAIYGPASSIWPARLTEGGMAQLVSPVDLEGSRRDLVACMKPQHGPASRPRFDINGRFRLAEPAALRDRTAFIYEEDRLKGVYVLKEILAT